MIQPDNQFNPIQLNLIKLDWKIDKTQPNLIHLHPYVMVRNFEV